MSQDHHHPMDEQELDQLLREASLGKESMSDEKLIDAMTAEVFDSPEIIAPNASRATALLRRLAREFNLKGNFPGLSFLIGGILIVSTLLYFFWPSEKTEQQQATNSTTPRVASSMTAAKTMHDTFAAPITTAIKEDTLSQELQTITTPVVYDTGFIQPKEKEGYRPTRYRQTEPYSDADDIPILTDVERKKYAAEKIDLLRKIAKHDQLLKLTPGNVVLRGHPMGWGGSVEIKTGETTNEEYTVFLHDLLVQGREDDYRKARPDPKGWTKAGYPRLDTMYPTKGYREFPVVNISREGAVLFCDWLTQSFAEAVQSNTVKWKELPVRFELPSELDWTRAARGDDLKIHYPWGYVRDSVQNLVGCCLCNFNMTKSTGLTTLHSRCMSTSTKGLSNVTSAGRALDSLVIAKVYSYNPNKLGTYCMSGNAAEMAWAVDSIGIKKDGEAIALGGSWNCKKEDVMIESSQQYKGVTSPSPEIGFRFIMRTMSKPTLISVSYTASSGIDSGKVKTIDVPVLGAKSKEENDKFKKRIIKAVIDHDKDAYAYIPMGTTHVNNAIVSMQAFYMSKTEVTNLQYRTFLNDLVLQKRYEEYAKARVDENAWNTAFPRSYNEPMAEHYFNHPAYDNYPVVNVPREGAELYCKWLSTEAYNAQTPEQRLKSPLNDLRLPYESEWEYAAKGGSDTAIYPWTGKYLRDARGIYQCNFMDVDTNTDGNISNNYIADGAFHTATVTSYPPNAYGLYNMAGNVSEMVESMRRNPDGSIGHDAIKSKGGSWISDEKNVRIESKEEYNNEMRPLPYIGFRPVMTYIVK